MTEYEHWLQDVEQARAQRERERSAQRIAVKLGGELVQARAVQLMAEEVAERVVRAATEALGRQLPAPPSPGGSVAILQAAADVRRRVVAALTAEIGDGPTAERLAGVVVQALESS